MVIPESQLETWSHQGSLTQSRDTYATVKRALETAATNFAGYEFKVFIQGSYCNHTMGLSPGVRQTVKALLTVRLNCIVLQKPFRARCAWAGEAEAGSAGVQPAKE